MSKGVLVDITKCIGCDACTVACKMWNNIDFGENARFHVQERSEVPDKNAFMLDYKNWTKIVLHKPEKNGEKVWRYVKFQCLHCIEPGCVASCFATALRRNENGAILFYPNLCVGCRYCMLACPFDVIKYEWEKTFPLIAKCHMCSTRMEQGQAPACIGVCPTNVMTFGDKDAMLALAKTTIQNDAKYVPHIYGETEAGGTAWMYISDIPFEQLGFNTDITTRPIPEYSYDFQKYTKHAMVGIGTLLTALFLYTKRRNNIAEEEAKKKNN